MLPVQPALRVDVSSRVWLRGAGHGKQKRLERIKAEVSRPLAMFGALPRSKKGPCDLTEEPGATEGGLMGLYSEAHEPKTGQVFPHTPAQHAEVLHPLKAKGQVFIGRKLSPNGRWTQGKSPYHPWELDAVLYDIAGAPDIYLSQNRFEGARQVLQQHVRELAALYVDIDYYDLPELAGHAPEAVLELALDRLRSAGMLEPSLALCLGRGLYLIWLHSPVGWKELPRWQDCQYRIWRILKPLGADPRSRDAARVLRIVGTTNSKNNGLVYAVHYTGLRRGFEELAATILLADLDEDEELGGADLYDMRAQHAARREYKAPRYRTERSLWLARWADLQTLLHLRYGEEQMTDFRDRWLFLSGVAMSWITDPPEPEFFERELLGLAEQAGGWSNERSRAKLQAVFKRVRMVARGLKVTWQGVEVDPRYRFRTEVIVQWLEIEPREQCEMYNLIGAEEKRRRNTESRRQKRRAAGLRSRSHYDQTRSASLQEKRATVRRLQNEFNLTIAEIAQVMGVSARTVRRLSK